MITNLQYLKTAIETLESGQTPMTERKILLIMRDICDMNIRRIEADLVDKVELRLYNRDSMDGS